MAIKGYWRLNGNSNDASGNGNNGTDTNITYSQANGRLNQGAGFNGSSSYVSIPTSASLSGTGSHTMLCWFRLSSLPATNTSQNIAFKGSDYPYAGWGLNIRVQNVSGVNYFVAYCVTTVPSTNAYYARISLPTMQTGIWYNIVLLFDSSSTKIKIFINGTFQAETTTGSVLRDANGAIFGAYRNSMGAVSEMFNGSIDEVIIDNTAWSPAQIKNEYSRIKGFF